MSQLANHMVGDHMNHSCGQFFSFRLALTWGARAQELGLRQAAVDVVSRWQLEPACSVIMDFGLPQLTARPRIRIELSVKSCRKIRFANSSPKGRNFAEHRKSPKPLEHSDSSAGHYPIPF